MQVDFYRVLGVPRDAAPLFIKSTYRREMRNHHPDQHPEWNARQKAAGEARCKELSIAYEVLGDPVKRAEFDRLGSGPFQALIDAARGADPLVFKSAIEEGIPIIEAGAAAGSAAVSFAGMAGELLAGGDYRGAAKAAHRAIDAAKTVGDAGELLGKTKIGEWAGKTLGGLLNRLGKKDG